MVGVCCLFLSAAQAAGQVAEPTSTVDEQQEEAIAGGDASSGNDGEGESSLSDP